MAAESGGMMWHHSRKRHSNQCGCIVYLVYSQFMFIRFMLSWHSLQWNPYRWTRMQWRVWFLISLKGHLSLCCSLTSTGYQWPSKLNSSHWCLFTVRLLSLHPCTLTQSCGLMLLLGHHAPTRNIVWHYHPCIQMLSEQECPSLSSRISWRLISS